MKLIVGLGNPGDKFNNNRANIGFKILDVIANNINIEIKTKKKKSLIGRGEFDGDDRIMTLNHLGVYELSSFDLSNHFDDKLTLIEKYNPEKVFSVIYTDGKSGTHYLKRFVFENTAIGKKTSIISEEAGSKLNFVSGHLKPKIKLGLLKGKAKVLEFSEIELAEVIEIKGMKAMGNRLSQHEVKSIETLESTMEQEETDVAPEPPILDKNDTDDNIKSSIINSEPKPKFIQEVQLDSAKEPEKASESNLNESDEASMVLPEIQVESAKEPEKPKKQVDFEITNPDDLDIDDQGQIGLF
jgi:topoisomerase-4 subunit A